MLEFAWLDTLKQNAGDAVVAYWRWLLSDSDGRPSIDIDPLTDYLMHRRESSLIAHLCDVAFATHRQRGDSQRRYDKQEVNSMAEVIPPSGREDALRGILRRPQGTLRIARSMRLLGRHNPAPLRDLIETLDMVRDRDPLIRVVAHLAQECELARARTDIMIVPDEDDLMYLLDDIGQHGAQTVARILIALSAVRYPRNSAAGAQGDGEQGNALDNETTQQES
jgi:hypothetical protein